MTPNESKLCLGLDDALRMLVGPVDDEVVRSNGSSLESESFAENAKERRNGKTNQTVFFSCVFACA